MIEMVTAWLINYGMITAGSTIAVFIGGWILKKIPFDGIAKWAEEVGRKQGEAVTRFFSSKLPGLWNAVIEPVIIDTINAICFAWIRGFVVGLKSDSPES